MPIKTSPRKRNVGPGKAGKRAQNKETNRQAILKAALELFRQKGFDHASTREISRRAGLAEGTLFNYFRTKEDLALYFLERELVELIAWYEHPGPLQRAPLPERLFAIVHHHLEQIAPYEDFIGAVYLRALQPSSKLSPLSAERRELNRRYLSFIRGLLAASEAKGELPPLGEPGAYGFALFHLAMITYWLNDTSAGKENTLAALDRCLQFATRLLQRQGQWDWQ
jgi:AcrR family transcriptional regulator